MGYQDFKVVAKSPFQGNLAGIISSFGSCVIVNGSGTVKAFNAASNTNLARGAAVMAAIDYMAANEDEWVLRLQPNTVYDIGANMIDCSLGGAGIVHIFGGASSIIRGGNTTATIKAVGLSVLKDFTVEQYDYANNYGPSVLIEGSSDAVRLHNLRLNSLAVAVKVASGSVVCTSCELSSGYYGVDVVTGTSVKFYDSLINVVSNQNFYGGASAIGVTVTQHANAEIDLYNCNINTLQGFNINQGLRVHGQAGTPSTVRLYGGAIASSSTLAEYQGAVYFETPSEVQATSDTVFSPSAEEGQITIIEDVDRTAPALPTISIPSYSFPITLIAPQLATTDIRNAPINDFQVVVTPKEVILSGESAGEVTVKDVIYDNFTTGSKETTADIHILTIPEAAVAAPVVTNRTPLIASVSEDNVLTYLQDGVVELNLCYKGRNRRANIPISRTSIISTNTYNRFVAGTFAEYMRTHGIIELIAGKTGSDTTRKIFEYANHSNHTYRRNHSHWSHPIDITCIPSATNGFYGVGVLISSDILIEAAHVGLGNNVWFTDNNDVTYQRTIVSKRGVVGNLWKTTDISICRLSSPVPASIKPAKVFKYDETWTGGNSSFADGTSFTAATTPKISEQALRRDNILCAYTNQFGELNILPAALGGFGLINDKYAGMREWAPLHSVNGDPPNAVVSGDSGCPIVTIYGNDVVALSCFHSSAGSDGLDKMLNYLKTEIAIMGGQMPTEVDLSAFPTI